MAKFTQIGNAFDHLTKAGKKSINLKLDKNALRLITPEDFEKGIYLFPRKSKNSGKWYYQVSVSMPDDYEYQFEKKETK